MMAELYLFATALSILALWVEIMSWGMLGALLGLTITAYGTVLAIYRGIVPTPMFPLSSSPRLQRNILKRALSSYPFPLGQYPRA